MLCECKLGKWALALIWGGRFKKDSINRAAVRRAYWRTSSLGGGLTQGGPLFSGAAATVDRPVDHSQLTPKKLPGSPN
jgi:hypothetical protein